MYNVIPSTRSGGYANMSVIPITHIVRSCHLIPSFGKKVDHSWMGEDILKFRSLNFFLNPYLCHLDFFLLRYLDTTEDDLALE